MSKQPQNSQKIEITQTTSGYTVKDMRKQDCNATGSHKRGNESFHKEIVKPSRNETLGSKQVHAEQVRTIFP